MDAPISTSCLLCDQPATTRNTDHGNRMFVTCSNYKCGKYEISSCAYREIVEKPNRKAELRGLVCKADQANMILDISVGSDGVLQGVASKRK